MPTRKRQSASGRDLCAQTHEDDGIDPREWSRAGRGPDGTSRKDLQLCKQVRLAVEAALTTWNDPLLRELVVINAEPAPDSRRIRIVMAATVSLYLAREREIRERLRLAHAYLRGAAAAAVSRKRSPQILLELVPAQEEEANGQ